MAFTPAPNVYRTEVRYLLHGQRIENTLNLRSLTGIPATDPNILGQIVFDWAEAEVLPLLSIDVTLQEVYMTDLSSMTAPTYTIPPAGAPPAGGNGVPALPGNVALCVSFRTAGRGRTMRGRNFVGGISDNVVVGNQASAGFAASLALAYETLQTTLVGAGFAVGVLSTRENNLPRAEGLWTQVTDFVVTDLNVDSQRRRLTGRGI